MSVVVVVLRDTRTDSAVGVGVAVYTPTVALRVFEGTAVRVGDPEARSAVAVC